MRFRLVGCDRFYIFCEMRVAIMTVAECVGAYFFIPFDVFGARVFNEGGLDVRTSSVLERDNLVERHGRERR